MMFEGKKVFRAGVIPYTIEDGTIKMLFMRPSLAMFGGDVMQICKGKVEDGEEVQDAALREASEEVGLLRQNVEKIELLGTFMGRTTIYIAKIIDPTMFGPFSFETSEIRWMTASEFELEGRELHRPVVRAAIAQITKSESI